MKVDTRISAKIPRLTASGNERPLPSRAAWLGRMPALLLVVALLGCGQGPRVKIGEKAPDFTLPRLGGAPASFSSFRDRVVFLVFWADWCRFCRTGMGKLNKVYKRMHPKGFEVVAVNVRQYESQVRAFADKEGLSFPVLLDKDGRVATKIYGIAGLPVFFIVDGSGTVRGKAIGDLDDEQVFEIITPFLEKLTRRSQLFRRPASSMIESSAHAKARSGGGICSYFL